MPSSKDRKPFKEKYSLKKMRILRKYKDLGMNLIGMLGSKALIFQVARSKELLSPDQS